MQKEIEVYLNWKRTYAPAAAKEYLKHLERFNKSFQKEVHELHLDEIVIYQINLQRTCKDSTLAHHMTIIRNFLKYWRAREVTKFDPTLIQTPKYINIPHNATTIIEFIKMDEALEEYDLWELEKKLIINLLWDTGMRISELCSLNTSDMDTVHKKAVIVSKKSNQLRWIFWSDKTNLLLCKYLGVRLDLNQQPPLFIAAKTGKRGRLSTRTGERWLQEIVQKAGITQKITPHSFRHAKAHRILASGGGVADIQKILGHSDTNPMAAFRYLRLNTPEIEIMARRFL